jgi:hypothetical protein
VDSARDPLYRTDKPLTADPGEPVSAAPPPVIAKSDDENCAHQARNPLDQYLAAALLFLAAAGAATFYLAADGQYNDALSSASLLLAMGLAAFTGVGIAVAAYTELGAYPHLVWMGVVALSSFAVALAAAAHTALADHGYLHISNRATFASIETWAGLTFVLTCVVLVLSALSRALTRRRWPWLGVILVATASALFATTSHAFDHDVSPFLYVTYFAVVESPALLCTAYALCAS